MTLQSDSSIESSFEAARWHARAIAVVRVQSLIRPRVGAHEVPLPVPAICRIGQRVFSTWRLPRHGGRRFAKMLEDAASSAALSFINLAALVFLNISWDFLRGRLACARPELVDPFASLLAIANHAIFQSPVTGPCQGPSLEHVGQRLQARVQLLKITWWRSPASAALHHRATGPRARCGLTYCSRSTGYANGFRNSLGRFEQPTSHSIDALLGRASRIAAWGLHFFRAAWSVRASRASSFAYSHLRHALRSGPWCGCANATETLSMYMSHRFGVTDRDRLRCRCTRSEGASRG